MDKREVLEVTKKQKVAGNICAGACVVLCGLFLLLCGLDVIPLSITRALAASILFTFFLAFLLTGIIQKNPVAVWIAMAFFVPALTEVIEKTTGAGYQHLYPMYIAIPAVASLFTAIGFRNFKPHLPVIVFFGILSVLFAFQSSQIFSFNGWLVAAPSIIVFIGLCIMFVALRSYKNKKDTDEDSKLD